MTERLESRIVHLLSSSAARWVRSRAVPNPAAPRRSSSRFRMQTMKQLPVPTTRRLPVWLHLLGAVTLAVVCFAWGRWLGPTSPGSPISTRTGAPVVADDLGTATEERSAAPRASVAVAVAQASSRYAPAALPAVPHMSEPRVPAPSSATRRPRTTPPESRPVKPRRGPAEPPRAPADLPSLNPDVPTPVPPQPTEPGDAREPEPRKPNPWHPPF